MTTVVHLLSEWKIKSFDIHRLELAVANPNAK